MIRESKAVQGAGEGHDMRALFEEHAASMFRVAYRLTGSRDDAEDVVQDVFLGLPQALLGYTDRGSIGAWLNRVAVRVALSRLRRGSRRREVPLDSVASPAVSDSAAAAIAGVDLQRALDRLPEDVRSILVLKDLAGYSHDELAGMLGITVAASRVRLHRARELLRRSLGKSQ